MAGWDGGREEGRKGREDDLQQSRVAIEIEVERGKLEARQLLLGATLHFSVEGGDGAAAEYGWYCGSNQERAVV